MFADSLCRPTIAVRDKAEAIAFYGGVLGLTLVDENQPGRHLRVRRRDVPRDLPVSVRWHRREHGSGL